MHKTILALLILLAVHFGSKAQKIVRLMDADSVYSIPFILKSGSLKLQSDQNGRLFLSQDEFKKYQRLIFSIDFMEDMDALIYGATLYQSRRKIAVDHHLGFDNLLLNQLFPSLKSVWFLRNKRNALDDSAN